ncbi:MAG: NADH-quinone oxidoreductase subunit NuoE [Alphaproteobacteria bacterium]|nr:NADH-quinone oxidoreductase subunit NuoE [Alphaproteobacteria bacterium]
MKLHSSTFAFNKENALKAKKIINEYPKGKQASALIPLLDLAQRQNKGWVSNSVVDYLSEMLEISSIKIYEVASFYSMINLKPVGKNHIQICRTTPCWLRGADKISEKCTKILGVKSGETTTDGKFTLSEVECLGACVDAPVVQINDDYHERLNEESFEKIIKKLSKE